VIARECVRLPAHVRRAVLEHAERAAPAECCGFIVGTPRRVIAAVPMENVERSPTRFRIADEAHIELRRTLRRSRPPLVILGVYHSHPAGAAWPSRSDIAEATYAEWLHVIVGLGRKGARLECFRIRNGRARPVPHC
jgi:proteasome lid subunit RPN8/RPN11